MKNETCQAHIAESLANELDYIRKAILAYQGEDVEPEGMDPFSEESLFEYGLDFSYSADKGCFVWLTSTGGPHTEFRIWVKQTNYGYATHSVQYILRDWDSHANMHLRGEDETTIASIFDTFTCDGDPDTVRTMIDAAIG